MAFNSYVLHLEHHKLAEFLALNIGIAIATVFRFWSYRKFVWRLAPALGPAGGPLAADSRCRGARGRVPPRRT